MKSGGKALNGAISSPAFSDGGGVHVREKAMDSGLVATEENEMVDIVSNEGRIISRLGAGVLLAG